MKTPPFAAAVVMLTSAAWGVFAQGNLDTAAQSAETEVVAVADVTGVSDCEISRNSYADPEHSQSIASWTKPCPSGTVVHAERMSLADAEAAGLAYVVSTGDSTTDEAAINQIKPVPDAVSTSVAPNPAPTTQEQSLACSIIYYATSLSYNAEGGRVAVAVYYQTDPNSCTNIAIYRTTIRQSAPFWPGADLYWDQEYYYGGTYYSWDMGCKQVSYYSEITDMWYVGPPGNLFVDETINDTSLGCDWWSEEYVGSVYL